jgi:predicted small metal-binding protein
MAKVINCQCGATLRGDSDDELVAVAQNHIQTEHPNLVGKMSREQLLSMASDEA